MKWTSSLSRHTDLTQALDELSAASLGALGGTPDLAFVFASEHHRGEFAHLPAMLRQRLGDTHLLGCSASGVIGGGQEIEQHPAIALTSARLPEVDIECWHLDAEDLRPGTPHSEHCARLAGDSSNRGQQFVLLADPFSFPTEQLLRSLQGAFPTAAIAGGMASGGQAPGEIVLFVDDECHPSGAALLALGGNVEMLTAVAQGCRPIGQPMFVSGATGGKISTLDGRPAVAVLNEVFEQASAEDRALMQHSLFIGIAMRAGEQAYKQGDFLIRNVAGADADKRSIWIAAEVRENQVIQFHLRDRHTSDEDLNMSLMRLAQELDGTTPAGGLLFSCTGRGRGLYGHPDHDSSVFSEKIGAVPLGGFFCNGEIGPVGGSAFVHAYTSAFALFRAARDSDDGGPTGNTEG